MWLHNFNVRFLLLKEDTPLAGLPLPAVTAGVHFKYNDGINQINQNLCGALNTIGYRRDNGTDFTLTMTKKITTGIGMPIFFTAGLRESEAAQIGFLGFGDAYHTTFEGNVAFMPSKHIVLAYEFRQKIDPYGTIADNQPGDFLIGPEEQLAGH